ncbi:hypothetical protein [Sediminimonas sp.]|uniref:hypothetical protein n=1 Tax=Sediminimonas sp. TaxID=2823379 RepID=UPI0025F06402|nr:hypothetical protein [Sediminimonas sp.]
MSGQHPCPAGEYTWWAAAHEEGPFSDTNCTNKDEAIREAVHIGAVQELPPHKDGDPWEFGAYIGWARHNHVNLSGYFDAEDWIDRLGDHMEDEDGPDENGCNHPLEDVSGDDVRALGEAVRSAIWHWQNRRAIKCKSYWLDMPFGLEWVRVEYPDGAS